MLVDRTLRPNPFQTYRDPHTGRWVTVLPQQTVESQKNSHPGSHQSADTGQPSDFDAAQQSP